MPQVEHGLSGASPDNRRHAQSVGRSAAPYEQISYSELAHRLHLARAERIEVAARAVVEHYEMNEISECAGAAGTVAALKEALDG